MKQNLDTKFIYADPMKDHNENEIVLNTIGTKKDLEKYGISFEENGTYWFWVDNEEGDPLVFSGVVRFDKDLNEWVAKIDRNHIQPLSKSEFVGIYTGREIEGND